MKTNLRTLSLAVVSTAILQLSACKKTESEATASGDSTSEPKKEMKSEAAGDPKAFADAYVAALKAKDTATLDGMMLTDGVPADTLEFFKMMREEPTDGTEISVEISAPTQEDLDKFSGEQEMPDGKMYKMPMAPSHIMTVVSATKGADGESSSKSSMPIGQKDGRFVILLPVPVAAK